MAAKGIAKKQYALLVRQASGCSNSASGSFSGRPACEVAGMAES